MPTKKTQPKYSGADVAHARRQAARQPPKPELTYVPEDGAPKAFVVYLANGEWRTREGGSTASLLGAGTFHELLARELAALSPGNTVISLERAVREATRSANPVVLQAIAAMGGR